MIPAANPIPRIYYHQKPQHDHCVYRYLCTNRPPMPGGIPKGAANVECFEPYRTEDPGGHPCIVWGAVEYTRKLTEDEVADYELIFDGEE